MGGVRQTNRTKQTLQRFNTSHIDFRFGTFDKQSRNVVGFAMHPGSQPRMIAAILTNGRAVVFQKKPDLCAFLRELLIFSARVDDFVSRIDKERAQVFRKCTLVAPAVFERQRESGLARDLVVRPDERRLGKNSVIDRTAMSQKTRPCETVRAKSIRSATDEFRTAARKVCHVAVIAGGGPTTVATFSSSASVGMLASLESSSDEDGAAIASCRVTDVF
jgi:hypothetical protein